MDISLHMEVSQLAGLYKPSMETPIQFNEKKQHHGCVTAWLYLAIIINSGTSLVYLLVPNYIAQNIPGGISKVSLALLALMSIINVTCAILILKWKKIGFIGFVVTSIVVFIINYTAGLGFGQSLLGLVGVGVLFAVLQIKQDSKSSWENLE